VLREKEDIFYRLGDDLAVAHLVDVPIYQAGDQGLTEAEAGLYGGEEQLNGRVTGSVVT
jgi:hypothetical protein